MKFFVFLICTLLSIAVYGMEVEEQDETNIDSYEMAGTGLFESIIKRKENKIQKLKEKINSPSNSKDSATLKSKLIKKETKLLSMKNQARPPHTNDPLILNQDYDSIATSSLHAPKFLSLAFFGALITLIGYKLASDAGWSFSWQAFKKKLWA